MKSSLLEEAIRRGARKEIPLPLEDLYLSWQAISHRQKDQDVFVLGVPRNLVDALGRTISEAGLEPYLMDLRPLALARAANRKNALIIALEPDRFDIVLVSDGIPAVMHATTPRGEEATLKDNIRQLCDEISRTVNFYNSSHPENNISPETPLLLTGELSIAAATGQLIQTECEYPVEPLVPSLKFPSDCPVTLYAANMGLALKKVPRETAAGYRDINVNILSEKYRKPAVHRVPVRYTLLIAILIIAIGLLIPLYQVKNQAGAETARLRSELSAYSQELREARLASDGATQSENTVNELSAEVKTIRQEHRDILAQGGNFANILRMVTSALPPPAYFTSIEIGSEQITIRGKADSAFTVVTYSTALEKLEEFSTVHIAEIDENVGAEDTPDGALRTSISFMIVVSQS